MLSKKLKRAVLLCAFILSVISAKTSHAVVPVVDGAAIAKIIITIKKMDLQIKHLESQIKLVQGNTGFSKLLENTVTDMHSFMPKTMPNNFEDVFKTGAGVKGLKTLSNQLKTKFQQVKAPQIFADSGKDTVAKKAYEKKADFIYANMAVAQSAYNQAGTRNVKLGQLALAVQSATKPKEREQLMARIMAENTLILNDLQQMLSLQLLVTLHKASHDFNTKATRLVTSPVKMDY